MTKNMIMLQCGDEKVVLAKNNNNIEILKSILEGMKETEMQNTEETFYATLSVDFFAPELYVW